jgi:hypothetical protein
MSMRRLLAPLAALVLGAVSAWLVACGGSNLIPANDASSLNSVLDQISSDYRAGHCTAATQGVAKAENALLNLPNSVDAQLRARLESGISNLRTRVPKTCTQAQTQTQQTQSTATTNTTTTHTTTTDTGTTGTDTGTGTGTGTTGTDTGTTGTGTGTNTATTGTDTGTGGTSVGGTTP